jgi:hypothetical protein
LQSLADGETVQCRAVRTAGTWNLEESMKHNVIESAVLSLEALMAWAETIAKALEALPHAPKEQSGQKKPLSNQTDH